MTIQARFRKHPRRRPWRQILGDTWETLFDEIYSLGWLFLWLMAVIAWDLIWIVAITFFKGNLLAQLIIAIIWVVGILMIIAITQQWLDDQ